MNPVSSMSQTSSAPTEPAGRGFGSLDQADFLRMLTVQMQHQDPFDPVDNKEMLAQMAQFSSLAGITDISATLKAISNKLDELAGTSGSANAPSTEEF